MVLCDLGGYDTECHLTKENVQVADGPHVRACGSKGGYEYGWCRRQHCFGLKQGVIFPNSLELYPGTPMNE